ncbi:hypothetical protein PCG10_002807 [Penicillium crustosum]|uniref:Uncharacterized protein n=1 Tax=Penicillium crustosum TaxID=36656 RepID=A0A9P5GMD2_PENCR|nr:hypothetical protein PCG10_002807 [Penicillium crustosum]
MSSNPYVANEVVLADVSEPMMQEEGQETEGTTVDNTIISTAVPRITHDFHSIDDVGWYASIYPLASCAFQPSYGKVYTLFSSKIVFLVALLIFEIGSVVNVFYIPLWFQIVNGVSAVESAILFIPFMLSVVGGFMFAGFGTAATGYYTPFVYAGSILMSIGTGLLMTVQPRHTSRAKWVGFQILCGAGVGLGEEQGLYMVQTTLPENDVATGIGLVLFAQTLGGALFVSVAQAVFLKNISKALKTLAPNLNPKSVLNGVSAGSSPELRAAYALAIKDVFRVGLTLGTVSSLGAMLYDWKSLKTKRDNGNGECSSNHELEHVTEARREDK